MKFGLISTSNFFENYNLRKNLLLDEDLNYEMYETILELSKEYSIIIEPYLYILEGLTIRELYNFKRYYVSFLVKSELLNSYNGYNSIYEIMDLGIEYLITCIICMQYYF
jgi:hypothetical protein